MKAGKSARIIWVIPFFWLLRMDLWWWDDPRLFLGMPIGLLYHVVYALSCAPFMALLIHFFWPSHLEKPQEGTRH